MKHYIRFILSLLPNLLKKRCEYVRLTPNKKGKIYFLDKKNKKIFHINSRGGTDSSTADGAFSYNEYRLRSLKRKDDILKQYQEIITSGKQCIIVDCGANIGTSSCYFALEYPEAKIIAVEPDIDNFELAKLNCAKFNNITIVNAAISSELGNINIIKNESDPTAHRTLKNEKGDIVALTIPSILEKQPNGIPFIIKVDIEGFEEDLFIKNTSWIDDCFMIIIELHDWMLPHSNSSQGFLKAISQYKRDFIIRGENIFSIKNNK